MKYIAIIKKRFKIPKAVTICGEDEMYAYQNLSFDYPKHKILSLKQCPNQNIK